MLSYCCFCIPLRIGCLLIGMTYIVLRILDIFDHVRVINILNEEGRSVLANQDKIKSDLMIQYVIIGLACVRILFGLVIIFVSYMKFVLCLRICCIILIFDGFASFIIGSLSVEMQHSYLLDIVRIVGYFYGGAVLWSYSSELDTARPALEVNPEL